MVDWLLKGEPREAQLEALRRSHLGYATRDTVDDEPFFRPVPGHSRSHPAKGWGHFLEMRIGKTPTHLNEGALFRRDYDFRWHIVIAPNAFKEDWPLEAATFGYPADAIALSSDNRREVQTFVDKRQKTGGLIAVNYEALKSEASMSIIEQVCGDRTIIGADESIGLKNPQSVQTKAAQKIAKECGARRVLCGKPITQGASDMHQQLRFIGQLNGVDHTVFKNTYNKYGGFQGKAIIGIKNEDMLHSILDRCSWNARKVDWLRTPGRDYSERKLFLLPDQLKMYERMEKEFLIELANGTIIAADQIITKLIKLQQIASGFIIDEDRLVHELMPPEKNPKALTLKGMIDDEIEHKVIVVCHYQHSIDILERALAAYHPAIIRGQQYHRKEDRPLVEEKARFNGDRACRVLIGQEQALRYGHTLMGNPLDPCYTTVFYENNYSLNDRSQCEERNQGSGQQFPINIIDFVVTPQDRNTIKALQRKEDIAATALRYARETGILPHTS